MDTGDEPLTYHISEGETVSIPLVTEINDVLNKYGLFMYDYRDNLFNDKYLQISENGKYLNIVNLESGVYRLCNLENSDSEIIIAVIPKQNQTNKKKTTNEKRKYRRKKRRRRKRRW